MKNLLLNIVTLLTTFALTGQDYKLESFDMTVSGTSTLHDWTSDVTKLATEAQVDWEDGKVAGISGLAVSVPVEGIISTKGSVMDGKTWNALKMDQYPTIRFSASEVQVAWESGQYLVTAEGQLAIAGRTRTVMLEAIGKPVANGGLVFSGSCPVNMRDYDIELPTALMGSIKTGEEVRIDFSVKMIRTSR